VVLGKDSVEQVSKNMIAVSRQAALYRKSGFSQYTTAALFSPRGQLLKSKTAGARRPAESGNACVCANNRDAEHTPKTVNLRTR
jgi:hypothetical protein